MAGDLLPFSFVILQPMGVEFNQRLFLCAFALCGSLLSFGHALGSELVSRKGAKAQRKGDSFAFTQLFRPV